MAVTKIKPVKAALKQRLAYIQNPLKTDGKMLVSSFGCSYETAYSEFEMTLSKAMDKGNNCAHHLIQSFAPGEATPEQAHEIGKRLADAATKGRHEYVLTTHIDRGHIHNHLIFCAASFIDYKKYISNKQSYYEIRNTSDMLCKEYGLSVVKPGQDKGKSYAEYAADRDGGSWKSKQKLAIDGIIPQSIDFEDFLKRLESAGYEIKRGKYISVRAQGQERFTRTKTLGVAYTEDAITKRIAGEYIRADGRIDERGVVGESDTDIAHSQTMERGTQSGADGSMGDKVEWAGLGVTVAGSRRRVYKHPTLTHNLIVDINNCVIAQQSAGFARWQKIENLKEAARTVNFLTENNLLRYADLEAKHAEVAAAFDKTAAALRAAEKRLTNMAAMIKLIREYQRTKSVYDGMKAAKTRTVKVAYSKEHLSMIVRHTIAARVLREHVGNDGNIPSTARLQRTYTKFAEQMVMHLVDYEKQKHQNEDIQNITANIQMIILPNDLRTRQHKKVTEVRI